MHQPRPESNIGRSRSMDEIDQAIDVLRKASPLEIQERGYHFQRRDYYSALNDLYFLSDNPDLWRNRPLPAAIEWDLDKQLRRLERISAYAVELCDVPFDPPIDGPSSYYWNNDFWRGIDAFVHYTLIRHLRPERVVEIGCGWSSLLLKRATLATERENGKRATVHQIEPYPRSEIISSLPAHWTLEQEMLQRASLDSIENLRAGDVLFYDGSHVARAGSDVNWFFFEVLPRVAPGVVIHIHDIFWPDDYPEVWIFERGQTWNEQYVLQAFLMYNAEFAPIITNAALTKLHRAKLEKMFTRLGDNLGNGCSVWLERMPRMVSKSEKGIAAQAYSRPRLPRTGRDL